MSISRRGLGRTVWAAVVGGAIVFAVQGGEYSTSNLVRSSRRTARLVRSIDSISRVVDSLARYRQRLDSDPALQERIAREQIGMVRDKELLYKIYDPDTAREAPKAAKPPLR